MKRNWVEFNINNYMAVKLTPEGLASLRRHHDTLNAKLHGALRDFEPPKLDADGWWVAQAWTIMEAFGMDMHIGMGGPFDTNVKLDLLTPEPK